MKGNREEVRQEGGKVRNAKKEGREERKINERSGFKM